jgi:type IV pilus biogenesis protein CpaD/CtpE
MIRRHAVSALAVAMILGGCTANDTTFGGALKTNIALQVIDPDPEQRTDAMEGGSGELAARAAENYRKGTVKQPVSIQTTGGSSASGSGSK